MVLFREINVMLLLRSMHLFNLKCITMDHYFVSIKLTSEAAYIVHKDGCMYMPNVTQRNYLGLYLTAKEAMKDYMKSNSVCS